MKVVTPAALKRMAWLLGILVLAVVSAWWVLLRMPGESYSGELPPRKPALVAELKRDLKRLAGEIGERNVSLPAKLDAARDWIEAELSRAGYQPRRQVYDVGTTTCSNIEAEIAGGESIVVVGAHYDSVTGCPGANDNGSGTVATLALARRFAKKKTRHTLRFLFFVNEEPPYFQSAEMGSLVYAKRCKQRGEKIVAMLSLETLGYFSDAPDSQKYPIPALKAFYGSKGNYIGFVANLASGKLLRRCLKVFRERAKIPSRGAVLFESIPGVGWSDQWSFWQCGYDAIMVTDTAPFRYPHYHKATDTADRVDYDRLALVVEGLIPVIEELVGQP